MFLINSQEMKLKFKILEIKSNQSVKKYIHIYLKDFFLHVYLIAPFLISYLFFTENIIFEKIYFIVYEHKIY